MAEQNVRRPDLFFHTAALETGAFRVIGLRGFEALSQLYELTIDLELVEQEPLDLSSAEAVLAAPAVLGFAEEGVLEHPWHGVLRELELVETEGTPRYRAVMVPSLWYATRTIRTRVFQQLALPELIRAVLSDFGFRSGEHFDLQLQASYPTREYVVQYAESDFDFLARQLEHHGVFFFFEQRADGETMVIADSSSSFAPPDGRDSIRYDSRIGTTVAGGALHRVSRRYRVVPQHVVVREYHPDQPSAPIQTDKLVDQEGVGLVMLHGQNAPTAQDQARISQVRAEERALERHLHRAIGSVRGVHAGHRFTLVGHPFGELADAELVVIGQHFSASQGTLGARRGEHPFHAEIDLIPVSVPYRPPRSTPRPRIDGIVYAKIDGERAGTPAPLDEGGRYRVLMPFDVAGEVGGRASCWMRRTQTFAGPGYGMHFPLHIGADVVVAHVEGDPDRPVIVGSLPTPESLSPVDSKNATQSVVRSKAGIVMQWEDDA